MRTRLLKFAVFGFVALLESVGARAGEVGEADLKAAFIYNFALFTVWPAQGHVRPGELPICISNASPLYAAMTKIEGRRIGDETIHLVDVPDSDPAAIGCRIRVYSAADAVEPRTGVLTIADGQSLGGGAVIVLDVEDDRVQFDIDTLAARAAGLVVSSKLLRLARRTR